VERENPTVHDAAASKKGDYALSGYVATQNRHLTVGTELSVRFSRGPSAAAAARNALRALEPRLDDQVLDDIRLLVSELVTNAIRHADSAAGGADIGLDVSIEDGCIRVEVADPGPGFVPRERDSDTSRPGGWGLYLVDRIADRWGVVRNSMNRVWFEIDGVAV
jgi:anti-sigma regulatory factor (Ser/Thr protein kinase)